MRALDRRAITALGIPGATLMEHAGRGAAEAIVAAFPSLARSRRPVAIVCGKGGNGGDGFVVARHLKRRGIPVQVLLTSPERDVSGDAGGKLAEMKRAGIRPRLVDDERAAGERLARAALVVDALLGTGARGAPAALVAAMIERINASGRPVVALDVPSGLPADGEPPAGPVVRAELTTTFAGLKRGLVIGAGVELAGRVVVVPIGVPEAEVRRDATTFLIERADAAAAFPRRARESHKGDRGRLLVVAGSLGKTGAAALAARAAMRTGAGLVTVATPASQQPIVATLVLEAMTEPLPETAARTIGEKAFERVRALAEARDAVAIGPGLGLDPETVEVAARLARTLPMPAVLDADALTALVDRLDALHEAPAARCLTPHPGEMARLLGVSAAEVQRDRIETARAFATRHRVHLALKGAATVVASPDGTVALNPTGNPGMASGGTGDVLTGIAGALLARGLDAGAALRTAVYLHGMAGDLAAARVGEEALIASDLIEALPEAFTALVRPAVSDRVTTRA
ncbi:MAG: NAD(P)H-hydrate dehydratase [Candidatus Rokubacteria bacterium]|nr:NAD(P)H-hydrate dehydratase [Candidatus Rokubacteria bacterium]